MVVTLKERKDREADRRRTAAAAVMAELAAYAARHDGRFIVFGSAARGDMRYDSDLDVAADFAHGDERAARSFAEAACRARGIRPDIHLLGDLSPELAERVARDGVVLR